MMTKTDVFIPCVYKDFCKLQFAIKSIDMYCKDANDIYVTMPDKHDLQDFTLNGRQVKFYNDVDILDVDLSKCKFRPNWIYLQLLKLFQRVTKTEYVFIYDADTVLIRDFKLFDNGKPIQYIGAKQFFKPYFNFLKLFSGDDLQRKGHDDTFIADIGMFNNNKIDEMLSRYGFTPQSFAEFTLSNANFDGNTNTSTFISEYEMYGNYIKNFYPDMYCYMPVNETRVEKTQMSQMQSVYDTNEIEQHISNAISNTSANMLKLSSGCCATDVMRKTK